jgi:hypothetical protein
MNMTLRIKRADGNVIQPVSRIYMSIVRHGFVFEGGAYLSERGGLFLCGDLDYEGTVEAAKAAIDSLMEELGPVCTGDERPFIHNAIEGPTVIVRRPREFMLDA